VRVTEPETALEQARASARAMRAEGAYAEDMGTFQNQPAPVTTARLLEWTLIEPDVKDVRSTRRIGAPVTALKRLLLRLLGQYHAELLAQQTRFNVGVVGELRRLEERIDDLERKLEGGGRG
jgi:hypothetical protein